MELPHQPCPDLAVHRQSSRRTATRHRRRSGGDQRTAFGIVADLTETGYVLKERDGRRNRYHIQDHVPLRDTISRARTIGEVLDLLVDAERRPKSRGRAASKVAGG